MRSLNRNKQVMYYALYEDSKPIYETDENGNIIYDIMPDGTKIPQEIGSSETGYSAPVEFRANISTAKGEGANEVFGVSLDYTRSISTNDVSLPICETSLIWLENEPKYNDDGSVDGDSADYTVVQVAKSINSIMYAVKQITK